MDKTQPIRLKHFHENDGGRAKNGTQCKQCGKECRIHNSTKAIIDFESGEKSW